MICRLSGLSLYADFATADERGFNGFGAIFVVIVLGVVTWLAYSAWRNSGDFRIRVRRGKVDFKGRFPVGKRGDATEFFLSVLPPNQTVTVIGMWTGQRVLRITVRGGLSKGECQRIRNFLKLTLKG